MYLYNSWWNKNTPTKPTNLPSGDIKQMSLGGNTTATIVDNKLYTWGKNKVGQLGIGNNENKNLPTEVVSLPSGTIKNISIGMYHSAAIINDGTSDLLYTWGGNGQGQLGIGSNDNKTFLH